MNASISENKVLSYDARFVEYSKEISLAILQHDYDKASQTAHNYIDQLKQYNCSKIIIRYNIYSLVTAILMNSSDYISAASRDSVETYLSSPLNYSTLQEYEELIQKVLEFLCEQGESSSDSTKDKEALLVKKIKAYVKNYYSDINLNVTSVADAINLSPNYMSMLFKTNTGEGLLSFINTIRIDHAKELLRTTTITIDEIAIMVGYSSSRSFRRNFLNQAGITATDYRNGVK